MHVFIHKMRQIMDIETDDGIFIDPVFTIFSKKSVLAINHKCNSRKVFIGKSKPTLTKEEEKNHTLLPGREIKL